MCAWVASGFMLVMLGLIIETDLLGTTIEGVYVVSSVTGLIFSSVPPIVIQLLCNTLFPIPAALVTVLVFMLTQATTVIVLLTTRFIGGLTAWYIMFGIMAVALCLSGSIMYTPLRRDEFNNTASPERKSLLMTNVPTKHFMGGRRTHLQFFIV